MDVAVVYLQIHVTMKTSERNLEFGLACGRSVWVIAASQSHSRVSGCQRVSALVDG